MMSVGLAAVMVAVEFLGVGLTTLSKAAMNGGMNHFVFVLYSNGFAAIFLLLPASLFFYWKRSPPPLTCSIICRIIVLSLLSCGVQTCLYTGIVYSSPTLSSAIGDLTPAFTFILAIFSGMEKLDLRVKSSLAKSIGTIVSIAGALTVTLYKGPAILITSYSHNKLQLLQTNWVIGALLLTVAYFFLSLLYIVQTWIIKDYPEELMVTFICCIFVTIQSAIVALIAESDPIAWKLKPDIELIAIGYSAVFAVAVRSLVHTWSCHKKGPVYTCMFKPLGIVIAIAMGVTFLRDTLYLGSIVGAAVIAFGFYSVIWGQAQEEKMVDDEAVFNNIKSSSLKSPLLKNKSMEI
ncbi:hypothetical protein Dsin_010299 [Dipteronia sinensis]|uniref:WAT1-related protein n=1 Tax=Dipteronia sinensis TaxID=43782 RepID=A0AAE0ATK0_9ROSI|nr:hypothetical protein Dsin_010299 [Dipteronia sinensis]